MSSDQDVLGPAPRVDVEVVEDRLLGEGGFLRLRRMKLRNRWPDGHESAVYPYDLVERDATDAVGIVLWADPGAPRICLRSALRPPLAFRPGYALPLDEPAAPVLWEVPAGLVEPSERGEDGLRGCAARETLEEVGLPIEPDRFARLGPAVTLSPGVLAEKLHFFVAEVDPERRGAPTEDGTPVEERAEVRFVPLAEALAACRDGRVADLKTETAIRRLEEHLR
ncbi:MAG: NUDIX domain-containing protein [Myxococcota bacterium]|nr:NUDIX domain-containing protein [Myxococcota bacterium]